MGFGTKLAIFGRRLKGASLRRMNQNIGAIHQETGKNRALLLCDMVHAALWGGVSGLPCLWLCPKPGGQPEDVYDHEPQRLPGSDGQ